VKFSTITMETKIGLSQIVGKAKEGEKVL